MPTVMQRIRRRWRQWRALPDRPFLLWITLELVGVAIAISVLEYLAGWHIRPGFLLVRRFPWLDVFTAVPAHGFTAVLLFWGLFWLQPRLWPWPHWRVPLWVGLVVLYGLGSALAGPFILPALLISSYGVVAFARVTRSLRESRLTLLLLCVALALGVGHTGLFSLAQFGIWVQGAVFVQAFTGLGMRERSARQRSEVLLAELQIAHAQLRAYADQAAENATLHERARLAREMHDTLVQGLAATVMHLDAALAPPDDPPAPAPDLVRRARDLARATMGESRAAILALAPPTSLAQRLAALRAEVPATLTVRLASDCQPLPPLLTEVCWRICQESVRNALKHGQAQTIQVEVTRAGARLFVTVTDDGEGFDAGAGALPTAQGGYGLIALRQRVAAVGGTCEVISARGAGTQVAAVLPLPVEVPV